MQSDVALYDVMKSMHRTVAFTVTPLPTSLLLPFNPYYYVIAFCKLKKLAFE